MNMAAPQNEDDKVPEVLVRREWPHLIFAQPCPYCGRRHLHGAASGGGHRQAHCADLVVARRGYFLVVVPE